VRLFRRHFLDGQNIAAVLFVSRDTLRKAAGLAWSRSHRHHVGQEHGEGLVTDDVARAPNRMAKAERLLLARKTHGACRGKIAFKRLQLLELAALLQRLLKLIGDVEMVLDNGLVAPRDENKMLDSGLARFLDDMLKNRAVDDRQHLFGNRFG